MVFYLFFENRENLNEGHYELIVKQVKTFQILGLGEAKTDFLEQISVDKNASIIKLENKQSTIIIDIEDFELTAVKL